MGSELQRFGFTGDGDDARWKAAVERMLQALVTNPHLNIGDYNSEVRFPAQPAPARQGGTTVTGNCNGFALSNTGTEIKVSAGNAGEQVVAETTVAYGDSVYLRITLDGTDGTYTAAFASSYSSSESVISVLLGSSTSEGVITQNHCGIVAVEVCRLWFAGEAPYYTFSIA
jgi:hypothetical protein